MRLSTLGPSGHERRLDRIASRTLAVGVLAGLAATGAWPISSAPTARADDWPGWRGPSRDGISRETGLLGEWPAEGPKLLWQTKDLGKGYGAPTVVGDRLFLIVNKGLEDELVKALDVKDGKEVWSTRLGKVGNPDQRPNYPAARSTPVVDGDSLYALGSDGDLACLEASTGKVRWQKSFRADFGGKPGQWAYAESPLVDGGRIVCSPGGVDATLVSLDKKTGEVRWKSAVPGGDAAGYSSAISTEAAGVKQYVAFLGDGLVGVEAGTGKFLWRYEKTKGQANAPTPVARDGLVYSGAGRVGGGLVKLTSGDKGVEAQQVYFNAKLPNALGGSVLVGDYLYGCGGQALTCVEWKTGEVKWENRSAAPGSLCFAEGRLYLHGEGGEVALIEATPEAYRERGRFTPPALPEHGRGEKSWAYPAIANGRLYIRDLGSLWCYDLKGGGAPK